MKTEPVFESLVELGRGGMGTAHLARAVGIGGFERLVVIKRLNPGQRQRPDAVPRFLAEARIAGRVHHANVVGTQQVGTDAHGPFIVLDYVEGGTLDELRDRSLLRGSAIPVPIVLRIALDALAGLEAVHQARDTDGRPLSILHRDMSLQNVLVGLNDGIARISDFGVAKSTITGVQTEQGYLLGKLAYLAPEYLRRDPVGPTLDLYSLGVTLWLAISGKDLWSDASEAQYVEAILGPGIPPLGDHVTVAPEVEAFIARTCQKNPNDRFQSAREMAGVIQRFDREYGWMASHAEVAAFVGELLGVDLARRRELIQVAAKASRELPTERRRAGKEPARRSMRRRILLGTVPLAFAAAGLGVLALRSSPAETEWATEETLAPRRAQSAPGATGPASPPLRADDDAAAPVVSPISAEATPTNAAGLPDASPPKGRPAAPSAGPTIPRRDAADSPGMDTAAPRLRPPDEIRPKNPYR